MKTDKKFKLQKLYFMFINIFRHREEAHDGHRAEAGGDDAAENWRNLHPPGGGQGLQAGTSQVREFESGKCGAGSWLNLKMFCFDHLN